MTIAIATLKSEVIASLSASRRRVFDTLAQTSEGMTGGELFEYLKDDPTCRLGFNGDLVQRVRELEALGLVVRIGRRTCSNTGAKATVWRLNDAASYTRPAKTTGRETIERRMIACANAAMDHLQRPTTETANTLRLAAEDCFR